MRITDHLILNRNIFFVFKDHGDIQGPHTWADHQSLLSWRRRGLVISCFEATCGLVNSCFETTWPCDQLFGDHVALWSAVLKLRRLVISCLETTWPCNQLLWNLVALWSAGLKPRGRKFIIYLSRVLCLSVCDCVCVSQFVSERSAILLVLLIKLTKETRMRDWRGRD